MQTLLDARWLAMFMICSTQDGWAAEQLPSGAEPDYANTPATRMGVGADIQKQFYSVFGTPGSFSAKVAAHNRNRPLEEQIKMPGSKAGEELTPLGIFELGTNLMKLAGGPLYKPPACPNDTSIEAAVTALNNAATANQNS